MFRKLSNLEMLSKLNTFFNFGSISKQKSLFLNLDFWIRCLLSKVRNAFLEVRP